MRVTNFSQQSAIYYSQRKSQPLVSVIITTKNEEKNIENCLNSLKDQTFKDIEIIVVDNYSKDKTVKIARNYETKVCFRGPERSSQRNYGADVSNGEYLLFLDADMILGSGLIEDCVEKCKTDRVNALYILERIVGKGFWVKVRDFERSFYTGTVIDAVRFVRKDLFERVGGFDKNLIGIEDWDFDRRIRKIGKTGIIHTPLCHNEWNFNMKRYLEKKKYYTRCVNSYLKKWGLEHEETTKQLGMRYRLIGVFVEEGKWRKLIKNPLLMIAMYYLRFRVALAYLLSKQKTRRILHT